MGGMFDTLSIGTKGLSAQQTNINVTSHNMSNVNTDGYTRQRAVSVAATPYGGNSKFDGCTVGQIGTGVDVTGIERIRDKFLDTQVRNATSNYSMCYTKNSNLSTISTLIDETNADTGVKTALSNFYSKFSTMGTSQSYTTTTEGQAISAAGTLANAISNRYKELEEIKTDLQGTNNLKSNVTNINSLLDEIDDYNKQIENITVQGLTANDLMDKRDVDLDKLSSEFGITVSDGDNDGVNVKTGNLTLADASDTNAIKSTRFSYVDNVSTPTLSGGTYSLTITYDKLGSTSTKGTITLTGIATQTAADNLKSSLEKSRILASDSDGTVNVGSLAEANGVDTKSLGGVKTTAANTPSAGKTTITYSNGATEVTDAAGNSIMTDTSAGTTTQKAMNSPGSGDTTITKTDKSGKTTVITTYASGATDSKTYASNSDFLATKPTTVTTTDTLGNKTTKTYNPSTSLLLTTTTTNPYGATTTTSTDSSGLNNGVFTPSSGEIAGNIQAQDEINTLESQLDKFAIALAYTVNAIQTGEQNAASSNSNLSNNIPIFVNSNSSAMGLTNPDDGISASNIAVNPNLTASTLNCDKYKDSGKEAERALAISEIKDLDINYSNVDLTTCSTRAGFFASSTGTGLSFTESTYQYQLQSNATNGSTLSENYSSIVSGLQTQTNAADKEVSEAETLKNAYEDKRTSKSGVSTDEEITNLVEYQHAYQANAKIISTVSTLLDTIIGLVN